MLPNSSQPQQPSISRSSSSTSRVYLHSQHGHDDKLTNKVFYNPNFIPRQMHFNPNFVGPSKVHYNPAFLAKVHEPALVHAAALAPTLLPTPIQAVPSLPASKTKINVTAAMAAPKAVQAVPSGPAPKTKINVNPPKLPQAFASKSTALNQAVPSRPAPKTKINLPAPKKMSFSIDNRKAMKVTVPSPKQLLSLRLKRTSPKFSKFKIDRRETRSDQFKITRTKLIRKLPQSKGQQPVPLTNSNRNIRVNHNGEFYVNRNGCKLTRVGSASQAGAENIRAASSNFVLRAKKQSVQVFLKNKSKVNLHCGIFQKIGKCSSLERGKCPMIHDRKRIGICSKFLQGKCTAAKCLLSHDTSLSKMPVCKFFLEGCCVKEDCPYLHKKLSNDSEICADFLKGFCGLADKCNKRHEFVCPSIERKGKCDKVKCYYCNKREKHRPPSTGQGKSAANTIATESEAEERTRARYFIDENGEPVKMPASEHNSTEIIESDADDQNDSVEIVAPQRPKLGELPAYIPL